MTSEVYLISGHGMEQYIDYESRNVLPKGTYLVALAECGLASKVWQLYSFMKLFVDPTQKELLQDPVTNKGEIERLVNKLGVSPEIPNPVTSLRVYAPGETYPDIYTDFYTKVGKKSDYVAKSGVYKYPMDSSFLEKGTTSIGMVADRAALDDVYENSLYPPQEMQGNSLLRISVRDVFKKFGPGVYYFPLCRKPMSGPQFDMERFKEVLTGFNGVDEDAVNKMNTVTELNDYYMSLPREFKSRFETSYDGREQATSIQDALKIPAIRAQSAQRQRTRGAKRRKGKKRTLRRKHFQRSRR